jgi:ankyrin repeat protein
MIQLEEIASRQTPHEGRGGSLRMRFIAAVAVLPILLQGCASVASGLRPVKVTETSGCSLCAAAYQGDLTRVTYLLQHGANPNASFNGVAPIGWAIFGKKGVRWDIVLMLLHYHADPGMPVGAYKFTALMAAAQTDSRALEALINAGADVNAQKTNGDTALIMATLRNNQEMVADLLRAKADPNIRNGNDISALDVAVANMWRIRGSKQNIPIIRMLLAAGAKPDSALEQLGLVMRNGLQANATVPPGTKSALRLLLAYGAKPQNVRDPLLLSVIGHRPDLAKMLINAGDPVDLLSANGRSALELAVKANDIRQVRMLLDFGGGAYSVRVDPLVQAYTNNNLAMVRLLVQRDADVGSSCACALGWPPKKGDLPPTPQLASYYLKSEQPFANMNRILSKYRYDRVPALSPPDVLSMLRSYEKEPIPALRRTIFWPLMMSEDLMPGPPEAAQRLAAAGNASWAQARSRTDAILAADQYEQAANLAPWVPAYQRNLCLLEYAAGEYLRAANDCMWYHEAFKDDPTVNRIYSKLNSMKNVF